MSDTLSKSSQAEIVELVEFADAAELEWREGAGRALALATGQTNWRPGEILIWMDYFRQHAIKRSPKAIEILTKFRHEYTVLKLTR